MKSKEYLEWLGYYHNTIGGENEADTKLKIEELIRKVDKSWLVVLLVLKYIINQIYYNIYIDYENVKYKIIMNWYFIIWLIILADRRSYDMSTNKYL